ncbi:hypothetical protein CMUS01_00982 [Colletotrichum musicola]|uniref:Uncharacterized protein n=1 Tax=Colletotrichum musicola TaxID=2175873 RepID=A0A8H6NXQ6_9PEZI|nr:hypothetical protein CMUS01_00982 [Colletotrichum musicola]
MCSLLLACAGNDRSSYITSFTCLLPLRDSNRLERAVRCGDLGAKPPPRSANPRDEGGEPARQGGKIGEATLTGDFGCVSVGTASWLSACYRWPVAARRVCGPCGFRFTASREGFLGRS